MMQAHDVSRQESTDMNCRFPPSTIQLHRSGENRTLTGINPEGKECLPFRTCEGHQSARCFKIMICPDLPSLISLRIICSKQKQTVNTQHCARLSQCHFVEGSLLLSYSNWLDWRLWSSDQERITFRTFSLFTGGMLSITVIPIPPFLLVWI